MATATKTKKLTRDEMRARLMDLQEGDIIRYTVPGRSEAKLFTILGLTRFDGALCKTRLGMLEVGKPETYMSEIKYGPRKGEPLEMSNIICTEWYAQTPYMNWDKVS